MAYKVIKFFHDLQDNNRPYNVGDAFPHAEANPGSEERIAELAGNHNLQGVPLIVEIKKTRKKKAAEE